MVIDPFFLESLEDQENKTVVIGDEDDNKTIVIIIEEGKENITKEVASDEQIRTCSDAGGEICAKSEKCEPQVETFIGDVPCCKSTCVEKEDSSSSSLWFGILLIIILAGGLWWVYKKTKEKKSAKPKDKLKERTESFKDRMNLGKEVRGGLDKV